MEGEDLSDNYDNLLGTDLNVLHPVEGYLSMTQYCLGSVSRT